MQMNRMSSALSAKSLERASAALASSIFAATVDRVDLAIALASARAGGRGRLRRGAGLALCAASAGHGPRAAPPPRAGHPASAPRARAQLLAGGGGAVHVAEPQTSVVRYKSGEDDASGELIDVKTQGGSSSSSSSGGGYGERYVPERGHERAQRRVRRTIERTEDCCAEEQYAEAPIALPPLPSAPVRGGGGGQQVIVVSSGYRRPSLRRFTNSPRQTPPARTVSHRSR